MIQPPGPAGNTPQPNHGPQPPATDPQHMSNYNHQQQPPAGPPGPGGPYR